MEEMPRKLYEAAVEGNVSSLLRMLQEDSLVLDKFIAGHFAETPLHIAAMLGHLEFTRQLLSRKPELAQELNSLKSSPLHLASANGHLEVVKELLLVNQDLCLARDRHGKTPLHIAVVKGRIEVLKELVQAKPDSVLIRTERGGTFLHLCVKYYQLYALKFLLEIISDNNFVNLKDDDGLTVLHLAVADRDIESVKFLTAETAVAVNALTSNGFTALDIALAHGRRSLIDVDIQDSLLQVGAASARHIRLTGQGPDAITASRPSSISHSHIITHQIKCKKYRRKQKNRNKWMEAKRNAIMVVASLTGTMAFQAGLNPPCGVWQDVEPKTVSYPGGVITLKQATGISVMAVRFPCRYTAFVISNTTGFLASLSVILLLISGLPFKRRFFMWILMVIMWVAVTSMAITYIVSISTLSSRRTTPIGAIKHLKVSHMDHRVVVLASAWFVLLSVLILGHMIRLLRRINYKDRR